VLVAGAIAAILLFVAEFSAVAVVDVASGSCEVINDANPDLADRCELSGFERNGGAFVLLAVLAAVMALGAGPGRSRPAAWALVAVGALVLGWALLVDLPVTDETGALGQNFEGAEASAGSGLTLEIVAGALLVFAGAARLMRPAAAAAAVAAVAFVAAFTAAAPAQAAPHVEIGIGEHSAAMFDDARFQRTGIRHARLIVSYDVVETGGPGLAETDAWLASARRHGIEPLVTFGHAGGSPRRQMRLPSVREYAARVREFRERYPWVRQYGTWNEANHPGVQPTGTHPRRTAAFYRALRRQCSGCTVVAVEILLTRSWRTWRWIRAFRRAAGRGPHIWGLHNYPDVTRLRSLNTGIFMRKVPRGEVWLTETGGIVHFEKSWPYDERRAARAVRHVFRLAVAKPRIKRIYLYNWQATVNPRWDSGFISSEGIERRAFFELLDGLALERFRPPPPPVLPDVLPAVPPPGVDEDD